MNAKLKTLILLAVKQAGSYDPDDALTFVEEQMTDKEYEQASMFLRWATVHEKTFGTATIDQRYEEYRAAWTPA